MNYKLRNHLVFAAIMMLIIVGIVSAQAGPVAVFTPEKSDGISIVAPEDGQWEYKSVDGKTAIVPKIGVEAPCRYLYFKLDKNTREKIGSDAWIAVDFFDKNIGLVSTQFNSKDNPYSPGSKVLLTNSMKWQRALVHLTDTKFNGLQNGSADFGLAYGGPITISRIEVYASEPKLDIPTDKERVMKYVSQTPKPTKMFYTFGNDADETTAPLYRSLGVTSIESYVTWESCEGAGDGKWDWSRWDEQVKILKANDLKWVPFLILGPAYSTPNWFRASKEHIPCRCLEHETDSKIESLWNPNLPKRIDKFISEFAKHYGKSGAIESLLLGIQGDYGEAIYSVSGGGWTFKIPGEYHNHAGYWCDDPYALKSFRKFIDERYGTADELNKAWGTTLSGIDKVNFPGRKNELTAFEAKVTSGDLHARRQWLDFIDWYRDSMTQWSEFWIKTTRKYFPETPIYLCTGGDAEPQHGSNFAEQCRVAAKYNAGVRITNEGSSYIDNFVITRWVASAGKHYGAYFGFEPAASVNEIGIVSRIYNATTSGANQLHEYSSNVVNSQSRIDAQRDHIRWLFHVDNPIVPVTLWYPNVDMTLKWDKDFFAKAKMLRDLVDYDYVDETMLHTGALGKYKLLVILHGNVMEKEDANLIADWIKTGGRVIVMDVPKFESVEGTNEPEQMLFGDTPIGRNLDKGKIMRVKNKDQLANRLEKNLRDLGLTVYDLQKDGIFGTQIDNYRFLFLNTGSGSAKVRIEINGKVTKPSIDSGTIVEVDAAQVVTPK